MDDIGRSASAALGDLRVLECGQGVSAAFCTRLLADFGAEVVKIEPPGGDPTRHWGPFPDQRPHPERSATFAFLNGGKKSVRLAGDPQADRIIVADLAATADVVVTNLSPAQRRDWNLDDAALGARRRDVIFLTLSPYGNSGPDAALPARAINVCAVGGVSVILGEPTREPLSFPFALPALQAGLHGAAAALAALLARRRCGLGQSVDIAEADVLAFYSGGMSLFILGGGGQWRRRGFERHGGIYPSGFYPCKDGYIFLATQTRKQWAGFLRLMGDPEWARSDPALSDGVAIGWKRADEVDLHFIPWLLQFTRRELTEMARQADLVLGPINDTGDLLREPHLVERKFWHHADLGGSELRLPSMGYTMSATPARPGPAPRLGEHPASFARPAAAARPVTSPPSGPLAGYRAIEFGWNWAGPMVGQVLADMGMEVIKVETRDRLDFMRHWPHAHRFFHNANRGKRSVAINIKAPGGAELVRRLAGSADLVFDNFAAGVMARQGLGYEDLRAVNPKIVVLSMAMAGQTGPLRHLRGFATTATGFAGLEQAVGYPDGGPTGLPSIGLGDANAAIQGVIACLAALWHRERSGEGQFIDLSQIEAAAALLGEPLAEAQLRTEAASARGNTHPAIAPHGIYPAAGDERWISLAVGSDAEWCALVREMGEPDWARDESLATAAARCRRRAQIDAGLAAWTRTVGRESLLHRLRAAGLAVAPVLEIDEMNAWPQLRARGLREAVTSFKGEPSEVYNTPWHLSLTPRRVGRPSPKIGEHNDEVFAELLGMTAAEIAALVDRKVTW
jgi:crotonobetainyl-CoA:carnitine CoA-transferase CaiB-like acyl-CoA transferase